MLDFATPIENLTSVGKTTAGRLKKIGIYNAKDLLWYFPRSHEDLSKVIPIAQIEPGRKICLKGTLEMIQTKRSPRKKMYITEAIVSDETGQIKIIWFNQPYLSKTLKTGLTYYFAGEAQIDNLWQLQLNNPTYEKSSSNTIHTARIIPIYPLTMGLTQKQIRFLIKQVLPLADKSDDWLPEKLKKEYKLINLAQALKNIHFPQSLNDFYQSQKRLKFDELFLIMLRIAISRQKLARAKAPAIKFQEQTIKKFVARLPFQLTNGQKKAAWEILQDCAKEKPMNRLLEGDVGSGKTVVAALAILNAITQNLQVTLVAPTEILARQHFKTFADFFSQDKVNFALFTRTDKKIISKGESNEKIGKQTLLKKIKDNDIQFIVGTHALLQENIEFSDLALIIIDEQHRFGVEQRQKLKDKTPDKIPHFLSMTATPIPRSLTLTLYGDLDISLLKEKPKNRLPVITRLVTNQERKKAYEFIKQEIKNKRQAFVVCPLIDESDKLGVKSATQEYENIRKNIFPKIKIGLVHGKLKKQEKEKIMQDFANNKINILVATSVVEVGVDIPNATVMMIEGADRFGLAQLHQFRGRVGRSDKQSYCFLFTNSRSAQTIQRLQALVENNNGFELAEKDLKFRGPGDIYGYKQSGLPEMKIASLNDLDLMKQAKTCANEIIKNDPELKKSPQLIKLLGKEIIHFE